MPSARQEAALEQLRTALRKVLAYEPASETSQVREQKTKYRRLSKKGNSKSRERHASRRS